MPPSLVVVEAWHDRTVILSLVGCLDLAGAPRFVCEAADALRQRAKAVVVDMAAVPFVDSAGLAALLNVLRRTTAARAPLVLVGATDDARRVFEATRLDREFTFAPTQEAAERLVEAAA